MKNLESVEDRIKKLKSKINQVKSERDYAKALQMALKLVLN